MSLSVQYRLSGQCNDGQAFSFSLEEQGWLDKYKRQLDNAKILEFIPLEEGLPPIVVPLVNGRHFIYVSRVFGMQGAGILIRLYGFGWQATIDGKNVKQIIWVYPNGGVEISEEPALINEILEQIPEYLSRSSDQ
jgi:hypothetical protein